MNKAQTTLVNYQHQLDLASYWGDGTTSSSDGMGMQMGGHLYMQTQIHSTEQVKVLPLNSDW